MILQETFMDVTNPVGPTRAKWISNVEELNNWLLEYPTQPLAVDTEFERVSTFYPIPGLVQLGQGREFRLVEPSVAESSEVFRQQLADPARLKLLYAMSEDLELLRHWLKLEPAGLIDLQIGAAMAGAGFSVGYARLVEQLFNETLDKSATRSDWLARPLSEAQERYATDDIRFLEPTYHWVMKALSKNGLSDALIEESQRFADDLAAQDDPSTHYLKLRGGWALSKQQQGVLKALVQWREKEARERNRPRSRVVADALLIAIADLLPGSTKELARVKGFPPAAIRRYGSDIVDLVAEAKSQDHSAIAAISPPLARSDQASYKQLKRLMNEAADESGVPIELLAPRKRLETVIRQRDVSSGFFSVGWRKNAIAPVQDRIEELLENE